MVNCHKRQNILYNETSDEKVSVIKYLARKYHKLLNVREPSTTSSKKTRGRGTLFARFVARNLAFIC